MFFVHLNSVSFNNKVSTGPTSKVIGENPIVTISSNVIEWAENNVFCPSYSITLSLDYGVVGSELSQKNRNDIISEVDLPMKSGVILKTGIKQSQLIDQSGQNWI